MDILSQSALLVAIVCFALAFSVLARNVKNKLFIYFSILCILVSGWALFFFLSKVWGKYSFYRFHLFFHIWLAPAAVAFIRAMVMGRSFGRYLVALSLLLSTGFSICLWLGLEQTPQILQAIYFVPSIIVIQSLELIWLDQRDRSRGRRVPQRTLISLGGLAVLCLAVMDHAPFLGQVVPVVGNFLITFYFFFLGQAVSQQRFLNLGAVFSRFLVLLGVALVLTGVYSLLFAWIEGRFALFLLNSFIVSFLILMLLEPLQKMVHYFTQTLLTKKYRGLENVIRMAQRRLATTVDANALYRDILETLRNTIEPEWAALFVLRMDGTLYRRAQTIGHELMGSRAPYELLSNHALLNYCAKLRTRGRLPILLDQNLSSEIDRSASSSQREQLTAYLEGLRALESNLLIPLFVGDRALAFVTLRVPEPPESWGRNWGLLQILSPYFEQAAQTLNNMEIYVRSREKERLAELGEMAAGLAHEIRNPLGAIKGAAQYLNQESTQPAESKFLKVIVEEVDRLNRVVTQFLDYSKPSTQQLESLDAVELVGKILEWVRPTLGQVQLIWTPCSESARVLVAAEQIKQVLLNFIQNSLNALGSLQNSRLGVLRVSVRCEEGEIRRQVVIEVEDNGPGIRPEHLSKIFIPFFTTLPSGTGLGLSICQKIIEDHRGRIEVATEVGRFARFSVILPQAP